MRHMVSTLLKIVVIVAVILVAFVICVNIYTVSSTRDNVHVVADLENEHVDAIVVLGASVYADGTPSKMLADRLDVAIGLYNAGAADTIIVSGDGRESHYDESDAMKTYCVNSGVSEDDVYVDRAGYNTYASMYRVKNVYGAESIIVVTQAYHLYRCLADAQGQGMQAQGVAADKGSYANQFFYSVREVVARTQDLVETFFHVQPEDATQPITL